MENKQPDSSKRMVVIFLVLAVASAAVALPFLGLANRKTPDTNQGLDRDEAKIVAPEPKPEQRPEPKPVVKPRHAPVAVARKVEQAPPGEAIIKTVSRGAGGAPEGVSGTNVSYGLNGSSGTKTTTTTTTKRIIYYVPPR